MNKPCYYCKVEKPIKDLEEIGVWVCKDCLKPSEKKKTKK